ncbi:MAG TPA: LysR family transcriptional regulator [Terriglobales bacterium]|nr:LysR family transcriptional regulator [Terriglobales bacterium]
MARVNLELYRIFLAVAGAGSFSSAARSLYISQPAVSQAIRQLEGQLGATLFVRRARGVELSAEGKVLYHHAQAAIALIDAGEEKLGRMERLQAGDLRIGAGDTITRHVLLSLLGRFSREYPGVALSVRNGTTAETVELLRGGGVDVAFVNMPCNEEGLVITPCMEVHDVFVAGLKYLPLKAGVTPEELAGLPLIMLERQSSSRLAVDAALLRMGVQLSPGIELGSHDLLLDFARTGLGVCCVIKEFTEALLGDDLFEVPLNPPIPPRSIGVAVLADIPPSGPVKAFMKLLGEDAYPGSKLK